MPEPTATPDLEQARQPLLADETVVLQAPVQAWSSADGTMGSAAIHGVWVGDVRVVRTLSVHVAGTAVETISSGLLDARELRTEALLRGLDGRGADPDVRLGLRRRVSSTGVHDDLVLTSRRDLPVDTVVEVRLGADASAMERVKAGLPPRSADGVRVEGTTVRWSGGGATTRLDAPGARATADGAHVVLRWPVTLDPGSSRTLSWTLSTQVEGAVVRGVDAEVPWRTPPTPSGDDRLDRWLARALDDLGALRMSTGGRPEDVFLAAGAPWFFTLFGRDSLWAARFLLPLDHTVAAGTLRVLAGLQGSRSVPDTAEQPGKVMHELRRETLHIPGEGVSLAPLYYGTIDATPLWICLLHDAWRAGMPEDEVHDLLPHLQRALDWMRDHGDSDGDGFLEYVDETGHGLANQGWKDSGDSVQWRDGTFAEGPIALCEVQAYAYEAAVHGADLLQHFGLDGADGWRRWAARLRERFRASFWVHDEQGAYPAIALDAAKRPVDSLTSNTGHLLGTGLLDPEEEALVAARLVGPELDSGYGLRTMSTADSGYWPLSYHRGSVWTHDTAIAVAGLLKAGLPEHAAQLAEGLLRAATAFGFRVPELHSGDPASENPSPVPYPAACRPQAWSAAAVVPVWSALTAAR
ncbi:glycogen debranching N-terminal domain-containing protein [Kineococcus sp. NPDC059986]|uniref:glycogen debranching N-terminal domain-containing protein n=1 Tax=Kineococcus sp. NPDC059986 TaxID=3155538 RepID=UPI0034504E64